MSVAAMKYDAQAINGVGPVAEKTPGEALTEILRQDKCQRYTYDDQGNGFLFADYFKKSCRHCPEIKQWYYYDGKAWILDVGGSNVKEAAKKLASMLKSIKKISRSDEDNKAFAKNAKTLPSKIKRDTMLKDAESVYPLFASKLDIDTNLFNCQNGTLRLDTLELMPHSPDDNLGIVSGVIYDPQARSELWERFLNDVTQGDKELERFLQKAVGCALTGKPVEECLFILYGASTRNGKGTFMTPIMSIFGDYAKTVSAETLASKKNSNSGGPSEDKARLRGARLANVNEPSKFMRFDAALVKQFTGRDIITARMLHQNSVEFKAQFMIFINSNYRPAIDDDSLFKSGRIKLIPFNRHFEEHEQDKDLKNKLLQPKELSAILNWMLEGLKLYRDEGLEPPQSVIEAVEEYRHDSDKIEQFMDESVQEAGGNASISTKALYKRYASWCRDNGVYAESQTKLTQALRGKGYCIDKRNRDCGGNVNHVIGIQFVGEEEVFGEL